ncbi:type II toxin-antitoxin system Phd/YefM family antitoxin [Microbacterium sp.]|uniref:type II toxin-antitoxin system Phd/YefM family antitoxin n=1 Tax=Microbacterium sp. TaxID=51671 RepID=UPI0039E4DEA9
MTTVNMHEAKTHLSRLVDAAAAGEVITIAKAGRPVAKITRIDAPQAQRRLGFLAGHARIPEDFDEMGAAEIAALFGDGD